jgi:2'-5' RNA ligase
MMGVATESAVLVRVPAAEAAVAKHRERFDLAAGWGVPAHVTVLYPFVPPAAIDEQVLAKLARAAATVPQFRAQWRRTGWFGTDVLWLAPEPESSFRALTAAVWRAFPDHPPYEGQFDDVVPHLTIGNGVPLDDLRAAEREVMMRLPITMQVNAVELMCGAAAPHSWRTIAEFKLGTG